MKNVKFNINLIALVAMVTMSAASVSTFGFVNENDDKKKDDKKAAKALDFKMKSLDGKPVDLSKYQGKVVMVVNVASKCGLTPQYDALQSMHEKYSKKGLAILGFPCNQFGLQEPGSAADIQSFCEENYGVKFDMFE